MKIKTLAAIIGALIGGQVKGQYLVTYENFSTRYIFPILVTSDSNWQWYGTMIGPGRMGPAQFQDADSLTELLIPWGLSPEVGDTIGTIRLPLKFRTHASMNFVFAITRDSLENWSVKIIPSKMGF